MAAVLPGDDLSQLGCVCQVAVVCDANAVGGIDVERLSLGSGVAACGWITHVADAVVTLQLQHVLLLEDVAHEPAALAGVQLAIDGSCNARRVLAAMLQDRQRVINPVVDRAGSDNTYDTAHASGASLNECVNNRATGDRRRDAPASRQPSRASRLPRTRRTGSSAIGSTSARRSDAAPARESQTRRAGLRRAANRRPGRESDP